MMHAQSLENNCYGTDKKRQITYSFTLCIHNTTQSHVILTGKYHRINIPAQNVTLLFNHQLH